MKYFFDTSALISHYIVENSSAKVDELFDQATEISVSPITLIESISTIKRLLIERALTQKDYKKIKSEFLRDFKNFSIIKFNKILEMIAAKSIEKYQLKTLDAIQLASAIMSKPDSFVVSDLKLISVAKSEKLNVINPNH